MTLVDLSTLNLGNLEAILLHCTVLDYDGWNQSYSCVTPNEVKFYEDWTYLRDTERTDQWGCTLQASLPTADLAQLIATGKLEKKHTTDGCTVTDTWSLTINK